MKGTRSLTILVLVLAAVLCPAACGQGDSTTSEPVTAPTGASTTQTTGNATTTAGGGKVLTVAELAEFDGKEGRPAYVAVDGVVYDVTGSRIWPEGAHGTCGLGASAGRDLSEIIDKAPSNMRALLEKMPIVGELAQ